MKHLTKKVIVSLLLIALAFSLAACGSKYHLNDAMKEHLQSSLNTLEMVADGKITEKRYIFGAYSGAYLPMLEEFKALGVQDYGTDTYNDCQTVLDYISQFYNCVSDEDYASAKQIIEILREYAE